MTKINLLVLSLFSFLCTIPMAFADDVPHPTELGLHDPATPQMDRIYDFHNMLLWVITVIVIFVTGLLAWVVFRYRAKANPNPSKTTHHVMLEVLWTVVPVVILIVIAVPSFKMLYYLDRVEEPEMTLKVTGYQWYWGYEYQDTEGVNFLSYMIPEDEIDEAAGQKRLLSTDNKVVLPIDTNIQIIVTAADVIHSFTVPAFGIKKDAVPGRMNETWVRIEKPGTYFGQCSEICGINHAYMPIEIEAVTKEEFEQWLTTAKEKFSFNTNAAFNVALLEGVQ
ncbi:MAG TPA: cytochrome c oxidase subunit II [Alphaproteobacteria bacterium]|nr:cytochrome c oxidase subunit II [Alphaproteobacteria bacterium]